MATALTNIDQFLAGGFSNVQFVKSTSGRPYDTAPAAGNGLGMVQVKGANAANFTFPPAQSLQFEGDDGVRGAIMFPPNAQPTFDLTFADFTGTFVDAVQGTTEVDAQSIYDFFLIDPSDRNFPDIFLLLTQKSTSKVAGEEGAGFNTLVFPLCSINYQGPGALATGANASLNTYNVTVNRVTILPWGTPLTIGTHGTTEVSAYMFFSEGVPTFDTFRQDNSVAIYAPSQSFNANEQVIAFDGSLLGTPSTLAVAYSSPNFTFTAQTSGNVTTFLYELA
jgi:hypothetical protein